MKKLLITLAVIAGTPALAASGPFFSLGNTDFVVLLGFLIYIGVLVYLKVPKLLSDALDKRSEGIQSDLDEARSLREEAQSILAEYERKQKEVAAQSEKIVANAKEEAKAAAAQAKEDLKTSIARRLKAAEDQIASAEASAVKEVKDTAVSVAVQAAADVITKGMSAKDASGLIDTSIKDVGTKLH